MALTNELMAVGMPPAQASMLGFDVPALAVAAAGTTQLNGTQLVSDASVITSGAGSSGVVLPNRPSEFCVTNAVNASILVYPPVGSTFAGRGVGVGLALTQNQTLWAVTAGTTIFAQTGAS